MYANRTHAARPSALTPTDVARQRAAIRRAEAARRAAALREHLAAWCAVAMVSGVLVAMLRAF